VGPGAAEPAPAGAGRLSLPPPTAAPGAAGPAGVAGEPAGAPWSAVSARRAGVAGVLWAFLRRDWLLARSYRLPFVMGVVQAFTSVGFLYYLARLVGPRIDQAAGPVAGGYFGYAMVGTVALATLTSTMTSVAHRLRTDQTTGTLETLFGSPVPPALIVLGSATYPTLFAGAVAAVQVALAVALGMRFDTDAVALVALAAALVLALALGAAVGMVLAAFVIVFKRGETATALAGSALSLVGGVYYPVRELPGPLRDLAEAIPFTWVLHVLRSTLLRGQVPVGDLLGLVVAVVVAAPAAVGILALALRRARRRGTLAQY